MMAIMNKIIHVIYAIALTLPLLMSLLYSFKILRDSKRKDKSLKFAVKLISIATFSILASFLIIFIVIKFIIPDIKIPRSLNILGIFIFFLYYATFIGFLYSLGELGPGGVSPNKVIRELYNDFFKKGTDGDARDARGPRGTPVKY